MDHEDIPWWKSRESVLFSVCPVPGGQQDLGSSSVPLDGAIQEPYPISRRRNPVSCSRTVPAGLDTLSGQVWNLLWNLLPR